MTEQMPDPIPEVDAIKPEVDDVAQEASVQPAMPQGPDLSKTITKHLIGPDGKYYPSYDNLRTLGTLGVVEKVPRRRADEDR